MKINLVALPTLEIPDQPARLRLESLGIYLVNLDEKDPFKLDPFPALRSPAERPLVVTLTPDQEADFPIDPTSRRCIMSLIREIQR